MAEQYQPSPDSIRRLEAVIAAAGVYVQPSDDLRPRVVEAAREYRVRRQGQRRFLIAAAALIGALAVGLPFFRGSESANDRHDPPLAAADFEQQAVRSATAQGIDPIWALYEAFVELRREQAGQWHQVARDQGSGVRDQGPGVRDYSR